MENIQQNFFSKNNIGQLNANLVDQLNIRNLDNNQKIHIANTLVKHMKILWKNLDFNKISNSNIKSIFTQFNTISVKNTLEELKKNKQNDPSKLKFERDFNSLTNTNVNFVERSQSMLGMNSQSLLENDDITHQYRQQPNQQQNRQQPNQQQNRQQPNQQQNRQQPNQQQNRQQPNQQQNRQEPNQQQNRQETNQQQNRQQQNNRQQNNRINTLMGPNEEFINQSRATHSLTNNFDRNLDSLFKPLIDNIPDEPSFNNYQQRKNNSDDFKEKLQEIQSIRNTEVPNGKANLELPEFLKSKATSSRQNTEMHVNKNNQTSNQVSKKSQEETLNFLDGMNDDDNLYSLDNIDKPLITEEVDEDPAPFSERLKRLENDRNNIKFPQQKAVDFKADVFEDTFEELSKYEPTIIKKNVKQEEQEYQRNQEQEYQRKQEKEYQRNQEQKKQDLIERKKEDLQKKQDKLKQQIMEKEKLKKNEEYKKFIEHHNEVEESTSRKYNNKSQTQRELFDQLKNLNKQLLSQINLLKTDNQTEIIKLQSTLELKNIEITKLQSNLELKDIEIYKLQSTLELKDIEITKLKSNLELRDIEVTTLKSNLELKDIEINKLNLVKDNKILNNIQLEIAPDNSINNYQYNFPKIENVIGIKLLNYNIPTKKFNIEENINNLFKYSINDLEKEIILETGFYNIDQLITILNEKQSDLIFELNNITQKITIKSEQEFTIGKTLFSINNLGFTQSFKSTNGHIVLSNKIWDLRIDNKVYLFLSNIDNENPFGILYTNTISEAEITFEHPVNLEYLNIIFKDANGYELNFYDINHYLNIQMNLE